MAKNPCKYPTNKLLKILQRLMKPLVGFSRALQVQDLIFMVLKASKIHPLALPYTKHHFEANGAIKMLKNTAFLFFSSTWTKIEK